MARGAKIQFQRPRGSKTLDVNKLTQKMQRSFRKLNKDAIAAFVRAAVETMVGHIDTGMSVGSFLPLAGEVGEKSFVAGYLSGVKPRKGMYTLEGQYIRDSFRSKSAGIEAGKTAYRIIQPTSRTFVYGLDFDISVFQHLLHESDYLDFSPYESMQAGNDAYEDFMRTNWESYLPDIPYFLITGIIRGGEED